MRKQIPNESVEIHMSMNVTIETSARHVHVTEADMAILFGEGAELTVKKMLSQPGQFLSNEKVTIVGAKRELAASILGPVRKATQVEISLTDARSIGVDAPVRESGDVAGSGACKLVGPKGEIEIKEGVIAAKRHLHLTPEDAEKFGIVDKQLVSIKVAEGERKLTFDDVVCRVSPNYATFVHVDTDEANAAGLKGNTIGEIIK